MKQEDKELLLKDLCARLPFGVKLQEFTTSSKKEPFKLLGIKGEFLARKDYRREKSNYIGEISIEWCKPYLRSMASMTEKERKHWRDISLSRSDWDFTTKCLDWLNAHHFDYHGLIEKGLALEASEGMYKFE